MNYPANISPAEWDGDLDECQACHRLFPVARLAAAKSATTARSTGVPRELGRRKLGLLGCAAPDR